MACHAAPGLARVLSSILALMAAGEARSQAWSIDNTVQTRFESNSNYQLSSQPGRQANQWQFGHQMSAQRQTENLSSRIDTGLNAYRFADGVAPPRVDGRITANQSWRSDRDTQALNLQFVQDTTLDTELRDTGVVLTRGRRRQAVIGGNWTHQWRPRTTLQADASISRVRYGRQPASGTDYSYSNLSGALTHAWTEQDRTEFVLGLSRYDNPGSATQSMTRDVRLAWTRRWSERTQTNFGAGHYRAATKVERSSRSCPVDPIVCSLGLASFDDRVARTDIGNQGRQYLFSYRHKPAENSDFEARLTRQVTPSGTGTVVDTRSGLFSMSGPLAPTLRGGVDYSIAESQSLGQAGGPRSRYQSAGVFLSYSVSSDLWVDGGWRRSRSDDLTQLTRAVADIGYVSLRYDGLRLQPMR